MKKNKLKIKIFILFLLIGIIPSAIIGSIGYYKLNNILTEFTIKEIEHNTHIKVKEIEEFLMNAKSDLTFLSNLPVLREFIKDKENSKRREVEKIFREFLKNKKIYFQLRYIDENGNEIIRIENIDGKIIIANSSSLQNKGNRYYFIEASKLNEGEIYISPLDLNVEKGKIEIPFKPTLRYATPIYSNSQFKGIVILNVNAGYFLNKIRNASDGITTVLINNEGYYLAHKNKSKEWGFILDKNENIKNDFPEISNEILSGKKGEIIKDSHIISYAPIYPTEITSPTESSRKDENKNYFWVVISFIPKNIAFKEVYLFRNFVILLLIFLIALVILFSYIISEILYRNIKDRDELLNTLLKNFEGKFGNIATIIALKSVKELIKKNPRIKDILPKKIKNSLKKEEKIKEKLK